MTKDIYCHDCRQRSEEAALAYEPAFIPAGTDTAATPQHRPERLVKVCPRCHSRNIWEVNT